MVKRISLAIWISGLSLFSIQAEEISSTEKKNLLEKLHTLKGRAEESNANILTTALSAFKDAMTSDTAAFDLYMKCQEHQLLTEKRIKAGDARDQKKKIKEKTTSADKRAMRYQLAWLVSSLEAAIDPDTQRESAEKELESLIVNIIKDVDKLDKKALATLKGSPYSSIFAKTYNISHLKPKDWPSSPLDYDGLYWTLICKPLIDRGAYSEARKQWNTRVSAEKAVIARFAEKPDSNRLGNQPVELEKYLKERAPSLLWKLEQELYNNGDERESLANAYKLIERFPDHKQNLKWIEWLTGVLTEEEAEEGVSEQ